MLATRLWDELFVDASGMTLSVMRSDRVEQWPMSQLIRRGEMAAAGLATRGVERGTPVAAIVTNAAEACTTVMERGWQARRWCPYR